MARISRNADLSNQRQLTVGVVTLFGAIFGATYLISFFHSSKPASAVNSVAEFFAEFPMHFQVNNGSFADKVKFFSKGYQYDLLFMNSEVLLNLYSNENAEPDSASFNKISSDKTPLHNTKLSQISLQFIGSEQTSLIKGVEPLVLSSNEGQGQAGHSSSSFMELKYSNIFPGVDVYFYGKQKQLFYEFVVAERADVDALRMKIVGTHDDGDIEIDMHGNVMVHCRGKKMVIQKPEVYRLVGQQKLSVNGYFYVTRHNEIRFREASPDQPA